MPEPNTDSPNDDEVVEFSAVTTYEATRLNGLSKGELKGAMKEAMIAASATPKGAFTALMTLLHALNNLSTSESAINNITDSTELVSCMLEGKPFILKYSHIKDALHNNKSLGRFKNKLRSLGRTFSDEYLDFYRANKSKLPPITRANNLGVPAEYNYLAADFLVPNNKFTEVEQSVLYEARRGKLNSTVDREVEVTNLNQLGRKHK